MREMWRKSSYSANNGACVEIRAGRSEVMVRDSRLGDQSPVLRFKDRAWTCFLGKVKCRGD